MTRLCNFFVKITKVIFVIFGQVITQRGELRQVRHVLHMPDLVGLFARQRYFAFGSQHDLRDLGRASEPDGKAIP